MPARVVRGTLLILAAAILLRVIPGLVIARTSQSGSGASTWARGIRAKRQSPADAAPLSFVTGDHAYEVEVTIDADPGATAGLLLFYSRRLYAGLGLSATRFVLHRYGTERLLERPAGLTGPLRLRLRNDRHIVTIFYSADGRTWTRFGTSMEVSGYHHNVAGEFLSLRPAIYAAGTGEVRFRQFVYRALD